MVSSLLISKAIVLDTDEILELEEKKTTESFLVRFGNSDPERSSPYHSPGSWLLWCEVQNSGFSVHSQMLFTAHGRVNEAQRKLIQEIL